MRRERWFGATGRKVPEIALEGTLDLEGALVLDDVSDVAAIQRRTRRHARRRARATAEEVQAALSLGPRSPACSSATTRSSRSTSRS